jgi:hypothetical protein
MAWTDYYVNANATGAGTGLNPTDAWTSIAAAITGIGAGPAGSSSRINVLAISGTPYAQTTNTVTFNTAGAAATPVWWRGYQTTIGDQDTNLLAVANTNIPQITFTTGRGVASGADQIFSNIDFNSAQTGSANGVLEVTANSVTLSNVRCTATGASSNSVAANFVSGNNLAVIGCFFKATTTAAKCVSMAQQGFLGGCYFGGGIVGLSATSTCAIASCVFDSNAGDAVVAGASSVPFWAFNCSIYSPTGNGFNITGSVAQTVIMNCYVESASSASKAAYNNTSGAGTCMIRLIGNASYNCTAATSGMGDFPLFFDNGVLASSGFTTPASQIFTPTSVLQNIAFPANLPTFSSDASYGSGGALQAKSGGGGANLSRIFSGY